MSEIQVLEGFPYSTMNDYTLSGDLGCCAPMPLAGLGQSVTLGVDLFRLPAKPWVILGLVGLGLLLFGKK